MSLTPRLVARALVLAVAALAIAGCGEDTQSSTLSTVLPSDGYVLLRAHSPDAPGKIGVTIQVRDPEPGTYVLLYSPKEPRASGWFALDAAQYADCRPTPFDDGMRPSELACVVPGGYGEVVDVATVDGAADPPSSASRTITLRHETCACPSCECAAGGAATTTTSRSSTYGSSSYASPPWTGYYGLLRVSPAGDPHDVVVEGISTDGSADPTEMTIDRL